MLIYGYGGHAKVLSDIHKQNGGEITGFFDDSPQTYHWHEAPFLGAYTPDIYPQKKIILAIGDNRIRTKIQKNVSHNFGQIISHSATLSEQVHLREGCMVLHRCIIQTHTTVGKHCILNTGCIVEHDCILEDFVHIASGSVVCGGVTIGEGAFVGAGAVILPGLKIGKWSTVGAGSVVLHPVNDYETVAGNPAKCIEKRSNA